MDGDQKMVTAVIVAFAFVVAIVAAYGFRDCSAQREAREKCMSNTLRTAAECLQAFPERR